MAGSAFDAALGGGITVMGDLAGRHQTRKFARENRDIAIEMSNTAYQRATTDMKAAGLNPMLMYGSGSAAGTVQGSSPDMGNSDWGRSAVSAYKARAERAYAVEQTRKTSAEATLLEKGIPKAKAEAELWQWGVDEFMPFAREMMNGISDEINSGKKADSKWNRPRAPKKWPIVTKDSDFMTPSERKKAMKKLRPKGGGRYR